MPSVCAYISLALAGITCPRVNAKASSSGDAAAAEDSQAAASTPSPSGAGPEPFALQGKLFTELRVLHRELNVTVHAPAARGGADGMLLGTIQHPKVLYTYHPIDRIVYIMYPPLLAHLTLFCVGAWGVDREISQWNWSRQDWPGWPTGH